MKFELLYPVAFLASLAAAANSTIPCYSVANYEINVGANVIQTPELCLSNCKGFSIIALKQGNQCYCLKSVPDDSLLANGECTIPCAGDQSLFCGGNGVFSIYTAEQVGGSDSSSSASSGSSAASSSTAASSASAAGNATSSASGSKTASGDSSATASGSATKSESASSSGSSSKNAASGNNYKIEGLFGLVASFLLL